MKSRYSGIDFRTADPNRQIVVTAGEIRKIVAEQLEAGAKDFYNGIAKDVAVQNMAIVFWALHISQGFGKKRLQDLHDTIAGIYEIINSPIGQGSNADDYVDEIKKLGINLDADVHVEFLEERKKEK